MTTRAERRTQRRRRMFEDRLEAARTPAERLSVIMDWARTVGRSLPVELAEPYVAGLSAVIREAIYRVEDRTP